MRAARLEFETVETREKAVIAARGRFLDRCQAECRRSQDADGLLPLNDASRILGWGAYEDEIDGTIRHLHLRRGAFSGIEDVEFIANDEYPFPKEIQNGFFRASDVIKWLEEARRQKEITLNWLEEWRDRLPTEAQWNKGGDY